MRNPLSKEAFADWAAKQTGAYDYVSNYHCAVCQYFRSIGLEFKMVGPTKWRDGNGDHHALPPGFDAAISKPHTYEALTKRLRESEHG